MKDCTSKSKGKQTLSLYFDNFKFYQTLFYFSWKKHLLGKTKIFLRGNDFNRIYTPDDHSWNILAFYNIINIEFHVPW